MKICNTIMSSAVCILLYSQPIHAVLDLKDGSGTAVYPDSAGFSFTNDTIDCDTSASSADQGTLSVKYTVVSSINIDFSVRYFLSDNAKFLGFPNDALVTSTENIAVTVSEIGATGEYVRFLVNPTDVISEGDEILFCLPGVKVIDHTPVKIIFRAETASAVPVQPTREGVLLRFEDVPSYGGSSIIYHADHGVGIWKMNPDGSGKTQLTDHGWYAKYSPDYTQIAFGEYYNHGIWVMNADGSTQEELTTSGSVPTWSPDGLKIAYSTGDNNGLNSRIWIMNVDGTGARQLSDNPGDFPKWSPDGSKIAYHGQVNNGIWLINPDGTGETQLYRSGGYPDWSPDGTKIIYVSLSDWHIWTMNADGTDKTKLTTHKGILPDWSPDGTKIAYEDLTKNKGIWVINVDGTNDQLINEEGHTPDWFRQIPDKHRPTDEVELEIPGSPVRVLIGEKFYKVSFDGQKFSRMLPRHTEIKLRYRTFDPLVDTDLQIPAGLSQEPDPQSGAYIVQFVTPPLKVYRDQIKELGGSVHFYLPKQAHIVRMSDRVRQAVEQLPFVRWVAPYYPAYKLEEKILERLTNGEVNEQQRYAIMVLERGNTMQQKVADRIRYLGGKVEMTNEKGYRLEATLSNVQLQNIVRREEILFIDRWSPPVLFMDNARNIGGANYIELPRVGGYTGSGVRGEVMDSGLLTTHVDFQTLPPIIHGSNSSNTRHGTSVYGIVFGDGTDDLTARGMLPDAQGIFSTKIPNFSDRYTHTQELVNPSLLYKAVFQTNSWGRLTNQGVYTTLSAELDDILFQNDILIIQAMGNHAAVNQWDQYSAAKNVVSVGGICHKNTLSKSDDVWDTMSDISGCALENADPDQYRASIGPAADGRIKPDLSHFYDNIRTTDDDHDSAYRNDFGGTSGATPITAGHFGLFFEMWADGVFSGDGPGLGRDVFDSRPHMTTAKALMINTASQYTFDGEDHDLTRVHQGWGMADVEEMYEAARAEGWTFPILIDESEVIGPTERHSYTMKVEGGSGNCLSLKATLVYADPAGTPHEAIVNKLHLKVSYTHSDIEEYEEYWGNDGLLAGMWSTPADILEATAEAEEDPGLLPTADDTVQNVFIQNPQSGNWKIEVLANNISTDAHVETPDVDDADYALVVRTICPSPCDPFTSDCIPSTSSWPQHWEHCPQCGSIDLTKLIINPIELLRVGTSLNYNGQTFTNINIESHTSISNLELEGENINEGLVSNVTIKPYTKLIGGKGGKVTGYVKNDGIIANIDFVGARIDGGYLAGNITIPRRLMRPSLGLGTLENVAILPDATVTNGFLRGNIDNRGTLVDVTIRKNAIVIGGTLKGTIQNKGRIDNSNLSEGTIISGGSLAGTITGNANNPALIENAKILEGTTLNHVRIGKGTSFVGKVNIGENVTCSTTDGIASGTPQPDPPGCRY